MGQASSVLKTKPDVSVRFPSQRPPKPVDTGVAEKSADHNAPPGYKPYEGFRGVYVPKNWVRR